MSNIRHPAFAGQFYSADAEQLKKQIEASFLSDLGPGALDFKQTNRSFAGFIVPHAGFVYSGPCAAHAYRRIAESERIDTFIILGPNHTGMGAARTALSKKDWETPFGLVKNDKALADQILNGTDIVESDLNHSHEHSIEVQLPLLQFIKDTGFSFIPISVSQSIDFNKVGDQMKKILSSQDKRVCVIASSDFTHYGNSFGYLPFQDNIAENLKELDMGAIDLIKKKDPDALLDYVDRTGATICGIHPILLILKIAGPVCSSPRLLKYYTSGDLTGDYSTSVSYASISFERD
jgi:hypothetical protein